MKNESSIIHITHLLFSFPCYPEHHALALDSNREKEKEGKEEKKTIL